MVVLAICRGRAQCSLEIRRASSTILYNC